MPIVGLIILICTLASFLGAALFVALRFYFKDRVGYSSEPLKFVFHPSTHSDVWNVNRARQAALDVLHDLHPEVLREMHRIDVHVHPHVGMASHFSPKGQGSNGRPTIGTVDLHRTHILARLTPRILITQYYTSKGDVISVERSAFFHEVAMHVVPYLLGHGIMPDSEPHPMKELFARLQRRMFDRYQELEAEAPTQQNATCDDC